MGPHLCYYHSHYWSLDIGLLLWFWFNRSPYQNMLKYTIVHKRCTFWCEDCIKTHLQPSKISKNCPGPIKKGRRRKREGKGRGPAISSLGPLNSLIRPWCNVFSIAWFVISIIIIGKCNTRIDYLHYCKLHHIMITFRSHSSRTLFHLSFIHFTLIYYTE